jgi:hypothetical protein
MRAARVAVLLVAVGLTRPLAAKPSATTSTTTTTTTPTPTSTSTPTSTGSVGGCVETLPTGAQRPTLTETFPARGLAGYAATLKVVVNHGRGEAVLPHGLDLQSESDSAKALKSAGFTLPDQDGGAAARLAPAPADPKHPERATTTLELPLVPLPADPGRHTLVLPPLPIAVARANGEIATACTKEHTIVIEDPTGSTPEAKPKPNPGPRAQREEWSAMRQLVTYAAIGLVVGVLLAYLVRKWLQRPRPVPPPPPPRPPWEIALEKLDEVRHAGLLEVDRFQEYFDRVNDAVRAYLGARYGFDGLESTTDEILRGLRRADIEHIAMGGVVEFLSECDLVKFANMTPSQPACERTLDAAERIVRSTMPRIGSQAQTMTPLEVHEPPDVPAEAPPEERP